MKIEDQVCSLTYSRYLISLGIKRECLFFWHRLNSIPEVIHCDYKPEVSGDYFIPAYTASELLDILPETIKLINSFYNLSIIKGHEYTMDYYHVAYSGSPLESFQKNLSDALASTLIQVIENGCMPE